MSLELCWSYIKAFTGSCIELHKILTKTVNFPVRSSLSKGSWFGYKTAKPSLRLVASCCSYRAKALATSNFRAVRNLTAVLHDTGPALLPARHLFTASINSFVAWKLKREIFQARSINLGDAAVMKLIENKSVRVSVQNNRMGLGAFLHFRNVRAVIRQ